MAQQLLLETQFDDNGDPLAGALAYVYQTGTTTPVTVYSDTGLTTPHAQPIVANAAGLFAQGFYSGASALKVVYKTAGGVTRYTRDPAPLASISTSEAADISFTPATGISSTDVQSAVEEVYGAITDTTANQNTLTQTGGSSNAYTLVAPTTISAYAAGQKFLIRLNHQNTGAATLNVDGLGAVAIKVYFGGTLADPPAGSLRAGDVYEIVHDGTRFVITNRSNIIGSGEYIGSVASMTFDVPACFTAVRGIVYSWRHAAGADRNLLMRVGTGTAASPTITSSGYNFSTLSYTNTSVAHFVATSQTAMYLSALDGGTGGQNMCEFTATGFNSGSVQVCSARSTALNTAGVLEQNVYDTRGFVTSATVLQLLLSTSTNLTAIKYRLWGVV